MSAKILNQGEPRLNGDDEAESPSQTLRQGQDPRRSRDQRHNAERKASDRSNTQNRELTDEERLELFRGSQTQSILPNLPSIPGYHTFWATTSNPRDSIALRRQLGYTPITIEEVPGWAGATLTSGELNGVICVNEMIAMKIRLDLYNNYMKEVGHTQPLQEEGKLRVKTELLKQQAEQIGAGIDEGEGMATLGRQGAPMPEFAE